MPEGPEVKRVGERLSTLEGATVKDVTVVSGRYARGKIHDLEKLIGAKVNYVDVKGKLIVWDFDQSICVLSTLGMTGHWVVLDTPDAEWEKHRRIEIEFTDGRVAVFFDPRNFGTFKVVSPQEMRRKMAELGPDILSHGLLAPPIELFARIERFGKKQTLAEALLDQRIFAGCGNYIRSDAMYLARLSPHRPMIGLTDDELARIWRAVRIVATASYNGEEPPVDLSSWPLEKNPNPFLNLCYHRSESPKGCKIESFMDANDRTVWWSPKEQV